MAQQDPNRPPKVPDGWLAKYDEQYKTFFYVDLATKKSQWEPPAGTVFNDSESSDVPPPPYSPTGRDSAPPASQQQQQPSSPSVILLRAPVNPSLQEITILPKVDTEDTNKGTVLPIKVIHLKAIHLKAILPKAILPKAIHPKVTVDTLPKVMLSNSRKNNLGSVV
ncbi:hypothetical protein QCA50_012822 [Cerrena zonata]|uniref:WW domain-containing protein n=1 Tax=Cerrena zonata TaxID=2478898 RepID=A0AAW0FTL9_9APHY